MTSAGSTHGSASRCRSERVARPRCGASPSRTSIAERIAIPSCSVNLRSGAFHCHGCGAGGGAYDAAVLLGLDARQAIDLMVEHGLTQRRRGVVAPGKRAPVQPVREERRARSLAVTDDQVSAWHRRLRDDHDLVIQLAVRRGWVEEILARHVVGWTGERVSIPIRDASHGLVGVVLYAPPWSRRGPKLVAVPGSRRALFPSVAAISRGAPIWLTEGEPDVIAAMSSGLCAVAIPGVHGWDHAWAEQFTQREVVVCMDCDPQGRAAAGRIAGDLQPVARSVRVIDLDPSRDDGFDLTDAILQHQRP